MTLVSVACRLGTRALYLYPSDHRMEMGVHNVSFAVKNDR